MRQFDVKGMTCSACSARVQKAVSRLEGVSECNVNLLTNSMSVVGEATDGEIISAVCKAGYQASLKTNPTESIKNAQNKNLELSAYRKRLILSIGFLLVLLYISMGYNMLSFPLPEFLDKNYLALGIIQAVLALAVTVINRKFFINGSKAIINRSANMDTLVMLGSGIAFLYSVYALVLIGVFPIQASLYYKELYFESSAMILALITLGKMLECYSKGKTTNAIKSLLDLSPKTVNVIRNGKEISLPISELKEGDVFIVRPGENLPADAVVIEGGSAVNECALTGESMPVDKTIGSKVWASTTNLSGALTCKAERVGEDTTLAKIIKLVTDASATKAPIAKIADKVSGIFVPIVMGIAIITVIGWLISGSAVGYALARGISVLVISCPCALGLATPVAIMVASGVGAKNGVLFKTAISLEKTGKAKIIALDKTGTITKGVPVVTDVILAVDTDELTLLTTAMSLEYNSEHPLSKAIIEYCKSKNVTPFAVKDFKAIAGSGVTATSGDNILYGVNAKYASQITKISEIDAQTTKQLARQGKTPMLFLQNDKLLGVIAVADQIKEDSAEAIAELKSMGLKVVMITGDNSLTASAIGKLAGVDEIISEVLPEGKAEVVSALKTQGLTVMVGDGINDAPALTSADVGIAVGAGSDVAIDSAEVILVNNKLSDVVKALKLSQATMRNIKQNLFWAFCYNSVGIPLATGIFIPLLGFGLSPMFGAAAMSLSSFCVVTNALRLNLIKFNKKIDNKKENNAMQKTIKIEGMMCPHCEARVKRVLEALPEITLAEVSFKLGTAVITLTSDVSDERLKSLIEEQDYKAISIE